MADLGVLPWQRAAVDLLDLRRQDRVLLVEPVLCELVQAVANAIGRTGSITVLEPDRQRAEAIAELELPQTEVLALQITGGESYGSFDALLHCPLLQPRLPIGAYGDLACHNLRPGGRYVIDLPGPDMLPDITAIAEQLPGSQAWLPRLRGPSEGDLAAALRNASLRRVETALGAHLLVLPSPHDLAELIASGLGLDRAAIAALAAALHRRLRTPGNIEVLTHRTRVHAIR